MGSKTKIDWCDATWNPVTGCYHGCPYCYARRIAERFGSGIVSGTRLHELHAPVREYGTRPYSTEPYPYDFDPTLHRYRLGEPQRWKKPRNIFVCSMGDLFGDWVPDEWIIDVLNACRKAPQHRYLFLTKNPARYVDLYKKGILQTGDGFWYGTTTTGPESPFYYSRMPDDDPRTFASIEPILNPFGEMIDFPDWIIIGAETGNRKGKVVPPKDWINEIAEAGKKHNIPVFMKESLREIMGEDFVQEFPWQ